MLVVGGEAGGTADTLSSRSCVFLVEVLKEEVIPLSGGEFWLIGDVVG